MFFSDSDSGSSSGSESDAAKASVPADTIEVYLNVRNQIIFTTGFMHELNASSFCEKAILRWSTFFPHC